MTWIKKSWRRFTDGMARARAWFRVQPRYIRWPVYVLLIAAAFGLPYLNDVPGIGPQIVTQGIDWSSALFNMSYYVLLALGLNVVVGYAGLLDLGYVGFFAVGTYTVALLTSPDSRWKLEWPVLATIPIAIAIAMLSGLILGWPTLRLRGDYLAIVTLGFAGIIAQIATNTPNFLRGEQGFNNIPHPPGKHKDGTPIFGILDAKPYFWHGLVVIIIIVVIVRNLDHSRVGRSWLAIREDEEAAEIMGVRTIKYKLWAFAIGASVGGLGGALFAEYNSFVNSTTFELQFSILILAGVVMGGAGNIAGAILGGALISYIPDRLRGLEFPKWTGTENAFEYRYLIFGIMIIVIMLFRPQGLIPSRRRTAEIKDRAAEVAPQ